MAQQAQSANQQINRVANPHAVRGYCYIAGATLCWGLSASLGRAVFTGRWLAGLPEIGPLILAQCRTSIALLVLAPILLLKRGPGSLRMPRGDAVRALLIGAFAVAGSNYFYYAAIQKTNVATAIILQYIAPVWVLLYMVARGLQRATARRVLSVVLAVVGSALAIGVVGSGKLRINVAGVIMAELAAITFATYNIAIPPLLRRHDRWKTLLWLLLGAVLWWLLINPPWRIQHYAPQQWAFLALFSMTSALVPYSLYIAGLQYLDATSAIVTSCLEPVFAIVIAAVALGELVRPVQVVGIAIVLAATVLVQLSGREAAVEPME